MSVDPYATPANIPMYLRVMNIASQQVIPTINAASGWGDFDKQ